MKNDKKAQVFHFDLQGTRESKYEFLNQNSISTINWTELETAEPNYFFVEKNFTGSGLYEEGFKIDEMFVNSSVGVVTGKDDDLVSFNRNEDFKSSFAYRPYDMRFINYNNNLLQRARLKTMIHIENKDNIVLSSAYFAKNEYPQCLITKFVVCKHFVSGESYAFPLYLYSDKNSERKPNLNPEIVQIIADGLGLKFTNEKEADAGTFAPIDILDYIYAVLHSPTYREKYKEFLKIDFPRVPYPKDKETFFKLVQLGGELRQIHLLESPAVEKYITQYPVDGDNAVNKIKFLDGKVYINDTQHFANVPEVAWSFFIGGYQPAQKWLKDRKGRKLEFDDILHYQKIIVALTETDRIMKEVDEVEVE